MPKEINFILPSNNDGGGNRWSYLLANEFTKLDKNLQINFLYPKFEYYSNIYSLDRNVQRFPFKVKSKNKFISIFKFFLFLKKTLKPNTIIIVSDPILSILMFFFKKNIVYRNIASDDYNLYKFSTYRKFGLIPIYKILTYLSFFYKNVNYIFNSQYTYSRIYQNSKIPFYLNNIKSNIIYPMIDDNYLNIKNKNKSNRERSIVIFPRKHSNKGFDKFHHLKNTNQFKELRIKNIYLVINKSESFKYYNDKDYIIINPSNDNDIINTLDKSYCFLSTSESEGFGLPPLEAMSRGCCPIIIDAGGTSSYCFNGFNSLVSSKNDINSLFNNIKIMFNNNEFRNKLSNNGLKTAKKFNQKSISNEWYKRITNVELNRKIKSNKKTFLGMLKKRINYYLFIYKNCDLQLKYKVFFEFIFYPFVIIRNLLEIYLSGFFINKNSRNRKECSKNIYLCLQDWSEYEDQRLKVLKNGYTYKCGLKNQEKKLISKNYKVSKYLYISTSKVINTTKESIFHKDLEFFKKNNFSIEVVENDYLDFSSYAKFFYNKIDQDKNDILIFMNSSVSTEFNEPIIDNYIEYFINNNDVGLLGISSNSCRYQSLDPFNFDPHVQSLFFITTTDVIKEVILNNNNVFPGLNASRNNKYSLILNGEIKLSKIIMKLGYKIAIINNYGDVKKFNSNSLFKNRSKWPLSKRDSRLSSNYPSQTSLIV